MRTVLTKASLRAAFAAPPPAGKRAFLHSLPRPRPSTAALVWQQLRWLRPPVWGAAALALAAALYGARLFRADTLWVLGALTPFLAVTLVTESGRSRRCGMAELEMAAALGLRSILLARMALLGALHSVLLGLLTVAAHAAPAALPTAAEGPVHLPWSWALAFVLLPYLLTAVLGLALGRRAGGGTWSCLGVAAAVAAAGLALPQQADLLTASFRILPAALPLLLAVFGWQMGAVLKQTEELPCS